MSKFQKDSNPNYKVCSKTPSNDSTPVVFKWKHSPLVPQLSQNIAEVSKTLEMQLDGYHPPGSLQCAVLSDTRLSQVGILEADAEEDLRESYSFTDVHHFTKANWAPTPVYVIRGATGPLFSKLHNKKLQTKSVQLFHQHPKGCQAMFQKNAECQTQVDCSSKQEMPKKKPDLSVVWLKKRKRPIHVMRVTEEDFKDQFTHMLIETQTTQTAKSLNTQAASTSSAVKLPCKKTWQMIADSQLICECINKEQQISKSDSLIGLASKIMQTEEPPAKPMQSTSLTTVQKQQTYCVNTAVGKKSASNQINHSKVINDLPREMSTTTEDNKSVHNEMGTSTAHGKSSNILASPIILKNPEDSDLPDTFTLSFIKPNATDNSNNTQNTLELIEHGLEGAQDKSQSPTKSTLPKVDLAPEGKSKKSNKSSKALSGLQKKDSEFVSKNIILETFVGVPDKLATVNEVKAPTSTITIENLHEQRAFSSAPSKYTTKTGTRKSRIEKKFSKEKLEITKEHISDMDDDPVSKLRASTTNSDIGKLDDLEEEMKSVALGPDYTIIKPRNKSSSPKKNSSQSNKLGKMDQQRSSKNPIKQYSKSTLTNPYDATSEKINAHPSKFAKDTISKNYIKHEQTIVEDDSGNQQQKRETIQVTRSRRTITEVQLDTDSISSPPLPISPSIKTPSSTKTPSSKKMSHIVRCCKGKGGSSQSLTYSANKTKGSLRYYTNKNVCRQCCKRMKNKKDKGDADNKPDGCKCASENKEVALSTFVKKPSSNPPLSPCNCNRCAYGPNNVCNTYCRCVLPPEPTWRCNCWQGICTSYGYCQGYYPNTMRMPQPMPGCAPRCVPNPCQEPTCMIYPRSQFPSGTDPCNPFRSCNF